MKRRRLALLSLAVASLALAAGTGAYSAMSADRGVDVRVANDDNAYITVMEKSPEITTDTAEEILLMEFGNNFPASSVEIETFDATLKSSSGPAVDNISDTWSGGSGELSAEINCTQTGTETLTFDIEIGTDGGVSASLTRGVAIDCTNASSS